MSENDGTLAGAIASLRANPERTAEMRFPGAGLICFAAYFPDHEPAPFILEVRGMPQDDEEHYGPIVSHEQGLTAQDIGVRLQVLDMINCVAVEEQLAQLGGVESLASEVEDFLNGH